LGGIADLKLTLDSKEFHSNGTLMVGGLSDLLLSNLTINHSSKSGAGSKQVVHVRVPVPDLRKQERKNKG